MGVEINGREAADMRMLCDMLVRWNRKINLTAIKAEDEIITKHLADSLSLINPLRRLLGPGEHNIIDVGTGAGFPGLVLWIMGAGNITLLDSVGKRFAFIEEFIGAVGASGGRGVSLVQMRAEQAGKTPMHSGAYDAAVARAVAELKTLCGYCLDLVRKGGYLFAMKGPKAEAELSEAKKEMGARGAYLSEIIDVNLRGGINHKIIAIKKDDL